MFPIPWNKAFRKKDGTLVNIADAMGGGGGGSFTPDYENDVLIIGSHGDYDYYIPMSKTYTGEGISGYEIKTNSTASAEAKIDLYSIIYHDGEIVQRDFIKTLTTRDASTWTYDDDYISIVYTNLKWRVTLLNSMYDTEGAEYTSPVEWGYGNTVDYTMLKEDPTQE